MYTADRNIFTDASKTQAVEENDPTARFLLVAKGQSIPDALAARFGLSGSIGRRHHNAGPDVDVDAKAITPEDDERIQNKQITPAKDKRMQNKAGQRPARGRK